MNVIILIKQTNVHYKDIKFNTKFDSLKIPQISIHTSFINIIFKSYT